MSAQLGELEQMRVELEKLQEDKRKREMADEIAKAKQEASGIEHPPTRTDPKVKATFEKAAKLAAAWNKEGHDGHNDWVAHGHMVTNPDGTKTEVCELHAAGSTVKVADWDKGAK